MEYGTAKVDELEKNGSSIVENDSFSRGERFSAIRGSECDDQRPSQCSMLNHEQGQKDYAHAKL